MTDELPDLAPLYERYEAMDALWRERRKTVDPTIAGRLMWAEEQHFKAQEPVNFDGVNRPPRDTIVIDNDGDGWRFGTTLWTRISAHDDKYLRLPGFSLDSVYGPYRLAGVAGRGGKPTNWRYKFVRPRNLR